MADKGDQVNMSYPVVIPTVVYRDPKAALAWLDRAFGFETRMLIEGPDGDDSQVHAEMNAGEGVIFIGGRWTDRVRSPLDVGGANTQSLHVHLDDGIDAHFAHARDAGATVVQEPEDQFYGDRTYRVLDLEGHSWTFGQTIRSMTVDQMAEEGGVTIRTSS